MSAAPDAAGRLLAPPRAGEAAMPRVAPEFIRLMITGRWIVVVTILMVMLLLPRQFSIDRPMGLAAAGLTAAYNLLQCGLLRAVRPRSYPPFVFVGIDLLLTMLLVWASGGTHSPFLILFSILIVTSAAFGDLRGSLYTATVVTVLEALLVAARPEGEGRIFHLDFFLATVPFLFLTAMAAGSLVRRLREQWQRRQEAETMLASLEHELAIAREVQSTFLHGPPPRVPGWEIAAHARPLYGVGGDLQDFVPLPDGVGVAVVDISGHSLAAALLGARLSHMLEDVGLGRPLSEVLAAWNRIILERTPAEVLVTAAVCEVRHSDGRVRYGVAGHPPPLHWRRETGRVTALTEGGPALGVLPDVAYSTSETCLAPGDVLLLYTDGAIEAVNAEGRFLGTEGLADLLSTRALLPARRMVDALAGDIAARYAIRDDLTLVAIIRS